VSGKLVFWSSPPSSHHYGKLCIFAYVLHSRCVGLALQSVLVGLTRAEFDSGPVFCGSGRPQPCLGQVQHRRITAAIYVFWHMHCSKHRANSCCGQAQRRRSTTAIYVFLHMFCTPDVSGSFCRIVLKHFWGTAVVWSRRTSSHHYGNLCLAA
jgi:hypothetical protein